MKRLLGGTIAVIFLFVMLSVSFAADVGETCVMLKGRQGVQCMTNPFQPFRGVIIPEDETVLVTGPIVESDLAFLRANMPGFTEDWSTAFYVEFEHDFGDGNPPQKLKVLIRPQDLTDCK